MSSDSNSICPDCGGNIKYYDTVSRIIRMKGGKTQRIYVRRLRCTQCRTIHRELPEFIFPYKQYDAEIIKGVLEGFITPDTIGYEDYPCEMTMIRWRNSPKIQLLLWKKHNERSIKS